MALKLTYLATAAAVAFSAAAAAQTTTPPASTTTTTTQTQPVTTETPPTTTQTTTTQTQPTTTTDPTTTQTTTTQTQPATTTEPATTTTQTTTTKTGQVTLATEADIKDGVSVYDEKGGLVGKVESVSPKGAIVNTGDAKAEIALSSFGKNDQGLVVSVTKAEIDAKAKEGKPKE
jgi:hypothetical protein